MDQLSRRKYLQDRMPLVSTRCQLAFSAAIAERLLPAAKASLRSSRSSSWNIYRGALDNIWSFLEGREHSETNFEKLRQDCIDHLPHDEDQDWLGGYGGYEAAAAVTYALDVLISSNSEDAVRASNQPINAMREYLIDKMFPDARTHRDLDENLIFASAPISHEVELQDSQLSLLEANDPDDRKFYAAISKIRTDSVENPIELQLR